MKNILKTVLVLFTLFSVGCSKKDDDKIDYYLSQPRDADLNGWWSRTDEFGGLYYWNFQQSGKLLEVYSSTVENPVFREYDDKYWFTEDKDNKNILNIFEKHGGLYGSIEYHFYYTVVNDTLWTSNGIEEYSNDTELKILWLKTTAPQY
ncbi:MAG: hypothetical protein LBS43_11300 [Prevotellaceae bacterium]|jgi:hypothetical protein|nr:hypothetical protein [Prevotellaceae bacterium]